MKNIDKIEELKNIISSSNNIVVFGGAGVSTASGIPDFRGASGLYNYTPEEVISKNFFFKHNKEFYDFYSKKLVYKNAKPNLCHFFCKKLEDDGKLKAIITQNIDGLHQKAGSKKVIELHGSTERNYCTKCGKFYKLEDVDFINPYCKVCGGLIKPDVVLYGENLDNLLIEKAIKSIELADTLLIIGTSLVVNPAASLIKFFKGKKMVLINYTKTPYDTMADLVINDDIINVIEKLNELGDY